jgi:hypothetical protein
MYEHECRRYAAINHKAVAAIKQAIAGKWLRVDCNFVFARSCVLTQKGKLKRMDTTSRIKACHDNLAEMLDIDDSFFISGFSQKSISVNNLEYVDIEISETEMRECK